MTSFTMTTCVFLTVAAVLVWRVYGNVTMTNMSENLANETLPSSQIIITCDGRCGQVADMPCSCDAKCLVYGNCCENFESDCPEVVQESRDTFQYWLDSQVECSIDNVFLISSCPQKQEIIPTRQRRLRDVRLLPGPSRGIPSSLNTYSMKKIFSDAPVTDTSTGFVYQNSKIYLCHARADSHPVRWEVNLEAYFFDVHDGKEVKSSLEESNVRYVLPSHLNETSPATPCVYNSIGKCEQETASVHLKELCQSTKSYVRQIYTIYDNRFCLECSDEFAVWKPLYDVPTLERSSFSLTIIMALDDEGMMQMTYMPSPMFGALVYWESATCSLPQSSNDLFSDLADVELPQCKITSCRENFTLMSYGVCKANIDLDIALADDGHPLTPFETLQLSHYFACVVEKVLSIEVKGYSSLVTIVFDIASNKSLYVGHLTVFWPLLGVHPFDIVKPKQVATALKAFKVFREKNRGARFAATAKSVMDNVTLSETISSDDGYRIRYDDELKNYFSHSDRGDVLDNTTITVCAAVKSTMSHPHFLMCWEDQHYDTDSFEIEKFEKIGCLDVFLPEANLCREVNYTCAKPAGSENQGSQAIRIAGRSKLNILNQIKIGILSFVIVALI